MNSFIEYIVNNIRLVIIAAFVGIILLITLVFFWNNTIVQIEVQAGEGTFRDQSADAEIIFDGTSEGSIAIGSTKTIVLPRKEATLELSTESESTISDFKPGWFYTSRQFDIKPQSFARKVGYDGGNCVVTTGSSVYSWECGALNANITRTIFDGDEFPKSENLGIEGLYFAYKHKDGLIGFGDTHEEREDEIETIGEEDPVAVISYIDFTSNPEVSIDTELPGFDTTSSFIFIDKKGSNVAVLDKSTGEYYLTSDVASQEALSSGTLADYKLEGKYSALAELVGTKLYVLYTITTDNQDDHSSQGEEDLSHEGEGAKLVAYDLTSEGKIISTTQLPEDKWCDEFALSGNIIGCSQDSVLNTYDLESGELRATIENVRSIVSSGDNLYLAYKNGVYQYDSDTSIMHSVFFAKNKSIGEIYSAGDEIYASSWVEHAPGISRRMIIEIDPTKNAQYPRLLDVLPINISDNPSVTNIDFFDDTVYAQLFIPGSYSSWRIPGKSPAEIEQSRRDAENKVYESLRAGGIDPDDVTVKFFY